MKIRKVEDEMSHVVRQTDRRKDRYEDAKDPIRNYVKDFKFC
jgi:hypothetical protein